MRQLPFRVPGMAVVGRGAALISVKRIASIVEDPSLAIKLLRLARSKISQRTIRCSFPLVFDGLALLFCMVSHCPRQSG